MTLVFLPRYLEPHKVPTNPRWCPYAKGSPREGQAPRSSNSVESHGPSPRASGGHDTNAVVTVSQDSRPTQYNNGSCKSRRVGGLSKLTQLTRIHLEQALERSN
jgi:hypothetical protein